MAVKFKRKNAVKRSYKNEGVLKTEVFSLFVRKINNTFRAISEKLQTNKI